MEIVQAIFRRVQKDLLGFKENALNVDPTAVHQIAHLQGNAQYATAVLALIKEEIKKASNDADGEDDDSVLEFLDEEEEFD